ncbi:hypothetical protein DAEQUDRAFT_699761 [Daedalea quercina L-15889]|uniref:Uncharacterized protein n=1 Tax=Daedalea quercina L-15889 TaxID=1314783 RepID=A0A165KYC9_9APHY|nr:hypothetical protein DAEQUDRAFT_699761 [Daedalea quercina L-15889]
MSNHREHGNDEQDSGSTGYSFPPAFLIGPHDLIHPLVSIQYVKAHLSLLGAFSALRERVETCPQEDLPDLARNLDSTPYSPRVWVWFVCLAVERFHRWAKGVRFHQEIEVWIEAEVPPLDVLMVWHAYMLNPTWYAEDCLRLPMLHILSALSNRIIPAVIAMGDPARYQPSEERRMDWLARTRTPFDPIASLRWHLLHHKITCPRCDKSNAAPYLTPEGTGYAQDFMLTCSSCSLMISKPALAIDKFVRDLTKSHKSADARLDAYLAGTLRGSTAKADTKRAEKIKYYVVLSDRKFSRKDAEEEDWRRKIKESFSHSIAEVRTLLLVSRPPEPLVKRALSAYTDDNPFSVDLVGAVIRQGSFVSKMHALSWTAPGHFDKPTDEIVLMHAITRYHAFLDLLTTSPAAFFVPTLDIDLVWHTHQLMAGQYADDCMEYVGRYIDHDDKVEENHLSNAFDLTCTAWSKRFKVPYTHCGCPLPGAAIGAHLQHLQRKFFESGDEPSPLSPPSHADIPPATHASEHNAVHAHLNGALNSYKTAELRRQRRTREEEMQARRERDMERVQNGELDAEQYRRGRMHFAAFLAPVPFASPAGGAAGCVPVNQTTCAAVVPVGSCLAGTCASAGGGDSACSSDGGGVAGAGEG